jgi:hypothetical protein
VVGGCFIAARSASLGVLQREHRISSQGKPPLTAWSMVGDGSIGSPSAPTEATLLFRVQGGFLGFQLGNHLLGSVVEVLIQDLLGDAAIALDRLVNFHAPFAHGIRAPMQRPRCRPAIYVKTPLQRFCSFPSAIQISHKR